MFVNSTPATRSSATRRWKSSATAGGGSCPSSGSSTENFDRWTRNGGQDAAARAATIWRATLERYEAPPVDDAVRAELQEYVARRRAELGD
jgi:Trimethylamine methyltransferase (MTTB)